MILALLALAQPAHAYKFLDPEMAWAPEDIPRAYYLSSTTDDDLPEDYQDEVIETSWQNWETEATACTGIGHYMAGREANDTPSSTDRKSFFYWDDPLDNTEVGVLGVTYPRSDGSQVEWNGMNFNRMVDADIVMNDGVDWATTQDVIDGLCNNETPAEGVLTHEIGHSWGLGHSCDQGEVCNEQDLLEATMYYQAGPCNLDQVDIAADDIAGINAIYGPFGYFESVGNRYGGTPLEVCFEAFPSGDAEVASVEWSFGDGEHSTHNPVCHTYTESGQYTVSVALGMTSEACGEQVVPYEYSELGYVVACEPPRPEDGADGFFQIEHYDGLIYQTINHTDLSVYGCVDTIQWEVYRGSSDADIKPENLVDFNGELDGGTDIGAWAPKIEFPEEGSYVVVMNVGGPGGVDASFLVVDAKDRRGETGGGCSTAPATGGGLLVLALAGAAALRRRRA